LPVVIIEAERASCGLQAALRQLERRDTRGSFRHCVDAHQDGSCIDDSEQPTRDHLGQLGPLAVRHAIPKGAKFLKLLTRSG
jgi:hypothetical protein